MPIKYFVTRHRGAITWAKESGVKARKIEMLNLDVTTPQPGDVVIGNLPVHMVASLNERGVQFWELVMSVPEHMRGKELTPDDMRNFGARLEEFRVQRMGTRVSDHPEVLEQPTPVAKVHMCIATGENLANILPMLAHTGWERAVVFATPAMRDNANTIKAVVEQARSNANDTEIKIQVVEMPTESDWASLNAFAKVQAQKWAKEGELIDFNVTGGTKMMTLAFCEEFRPIARLLYCSTDTSQIENIGSVPGIPSTLPPDLLDVRTYLLAQGFAEKSRTDASHAVFPSIQQREALTASLVVNAGALIALRLSVSELSLADAKGGKPMRLDGSRTKQFNNFQGLLHFTAANARPSQKKSDFGKHEFLPNVSWTLAVEQLRREETLRNALKLAQKLKLIEQLRFKELEGGALQVNFQFAGEEAATYLAGGYLEEFVFLSLHSAGLPSSHCAMNVTLKAMRARQAAQGKSYNELDAVAVWKNRLMAVECKAGRWAQQSPQDVINKLEQIKSYVGGKKGYGVLVSMQELKPDNEIDALILSRMDQFNIQLVQGAELASLPARLAATLGKPATKLWQPKKVALANFSSKKA